MSSIPRNRNAIQTGVIYFTIAAHALLWPMLGPGELMTCTHMHTNLGRNALARVEYFKSTVDLKSQKMPKFMRKMGLFGAFFAVFYGGPCQNLKL